jgi:Mg-chelatase subunit ChlD
MNTVMPRLAPRAKVLALLLSAGFCCGTCCGQSGRLDFADKVRLVNCQPSTDKPCFRLKFNVVDAQGAPLNINLPPNKDIRGQLKIHVNNQDMEPFLAVSQSGSTQAVRGRIAVILVDVSGSMNQRLASGKTRFETAQAALAQFLEGFEDNVDRVAIVPFESHDVASRILSAQFATTKSQALLQITALPTPGPKNNTALYSAVVLGLQVLAKQSSGASASGTISPETLLLVMTDGKNEVFPTDDPGLLDGSAGLQEAAETVRAFGNEVIGVGFGDPGSIDEDALGRISTKTFMAEDLEKLKQVYSIAHTLLAGRIVATFPSPWDDRASLEGRTLRITATLLTGLQRFESGERVWSAPQMSMPAFDEPCDAAEVRAALSINPAPGNWLSTLRPALVFAGLATLLLVLWFWVPRLVWPEQYIGNFPAASGGMRWTSMSRGWSARKVRPSRPPPPGFQTGRGSAQPPRAPADHTVVQPQPDFSRSRLHKRPPNEKDR